MEKKDMTLSEMLEMQRKLREKYTYWDPLIPENGRSTLLWAVAEIGEVADILKKEGEARVMSDPQVRAHFVEEVGDVMMFLGDLMICYGITAEELADSYRTKFSRNMERW